MKTALVLGASGLVGSHVLQKLLADVSYTKVIAWVRSPLPFTHPKLQVDQVDFHNLPSIQADELFSCLGTTKSKTPDLNQYRHIEVEIPVQAAKKTQGLRQLHYISSIGTSASSTGYYLKFKWEAECALRALELPALFLYRPSLIYGERKEMRLLENISSFIFTLVNPLLVGRAKKLRRIAGEQIAETMCIMAQQDEKGTHILESDRIQAIASEHTPKQYKH
jgi:uncharacterized protein YbjT (DUF2867 family)